MTACNSMLVIMLSSFGVLALACGAGRTPLYMWNASASVPLGVYGLHPSNTRYVGELVAVVPPESVATFLAEGSYLPRGVPMLKHVLALPWANRLQKRIHDFRQRHRDGAGARP